MTQTIDNRLLPLIGETAWHTLVVDPRIAAESQRHYQEILALLREHSQTAGHDLHILEIACYAHTTGYRLAENPGAQVTLFELSQHSLRLGYELGKSAGPAHPRLVTGDFHHLPFADASFNVIYICSALHHTWHYPQVLREMARVLAPDGLLFLENEPTHRSFCFYRFRCNRAHELTAFETRLAHLGLLRTVAEPYPGSRPESLFGMVENQGMPLETILEVVSEQCEPVSLFLSTGDCMGPLENQLLQLRRQPAADLAEVIFETLADGFRQARSSLTLKEQGLGFGLPDETEAAAMAQRIGRELHQLPEDETSGDFKLRLAALFGAPLQLVARKRGDALPAAELRAKAQAFNQAFPCEGGVYNGFPEKDRPLLGQGSLLPDVQACPPEALADFFPESSWQIVHGEYPLIAMDGVQHQLRSIVNRGDRIEIRLPLPQSYTRALLVMRIFCGLQGNDFYRLELSMAGKRLASHDVFQAETALIREILERPLLAESQGRLEIALIPFHRQLVSSPSLAISVMNLYPLPGE